MSLMILCIQFKLDDMTCLSILLGFFPLNMVLRSMRVTICKLLFQIAVWCSFINIYHILIISSPQRWLSELFPTPAIKMQSWISPKFALWEPMWNLRSGRVFQNVDPGSIRSANSWALPRPTTSEIPEAELSDLCFSRCCRWWWCTHSSLRTTALCPTALRASTWLRNGCRGCATRRVWSPFREKSSYCPSLHVDS